jgi:predicted Fe-S protein YdhL (DUF1289 family)
MKSQHLLPLLAAAIGFAVAWAVKPAAIAPVGTISENTKPGAKTLPRNDSPRHRPSSVAEKRPKEVKAGDFPLADLADQGPKTRSEAKMLRLNEALGLSIDQQGSIIKALEDAKAAVDDQVPVIQDLAARGKTLEAALAKILTPEQLAKFEELRTRERENRIEARAQRVLSHMIEEIDVSPGQRDEVLARLRQSAKEQVQEIPASATLLLSSSMLPTDASDPSVDALLMLARIGEDPPSPDNPLEAHRIILARQRQEIEEQLQNYDGILTSGQMGQIHAAIAEKRAILEHLKQRHKRQDEKPAPAPQTPPAPSVPPAPSSPEDEEDEEEDEYSE